MSRFICHFYSDPLTCVGAAELDAIAMGIGFGRHGSIWKHRYHDVTYCLHHLNWNDHANRWEAVMFPDGS